MYIVYRSTSDGTRYASAAVSKRNGSRTSVSYTYLGRVLDEKAGIYQSEERGIFTFDPKSGEFGRADPSFVPPERRRRLRAEGIMADFGDAWLVNAFLEKSGFLQVLDRTGCRNTDTLRAMLLFYVLSSTAGTDPCRWYEGSIARLIYPSARMAGSGAADFLKSAGTEEMRRTFLESWISYVPERFRKEHVILADGCSLPGGIHAPYTERTPKGGRTGSELRLFYAFGRSTGLPVWFRDFPGCTADAPAMERALLYCKANGIRAGSCIMEAPCGTGRDLDLLLGWSRHTKNSFIARLRSDDSSLRLMIDDELSSMLDKNNLVLYGDRMIFVKKRRIMAGSGSGLPAWMYLGLDCALLPDDLSRLPGRPHGEKPDSLEIFRAMESGALFAFVSGHEYSCEEVTALYDERKAADHMMDFSGNLQGIMRHLVKTPEALHGHLLLSFMAACAAGMIKTRLRSARMDFVPAMAELRNQKCMVFSARVETGPLCERAGKIYRALGIDCPSSIPLAGGRLRYRENEAEKQQPSRPYSGRPDGQEDCMAPESGSGKEESSIYW
jgi:hypothetical protein